MKAFAIAAGVLAAAVTSGTAMGSATFYLSTVSPESAATPVPGNPRMYITPWQPVTLYLWAQLSSASSTGMGLDLVETNPAVVTVTNVSIANPVVFRDPDDPENPESWLYRWNGYDVTTGGMGGFAAAGGFNDPAGVNAVGLTTLYGATDPTRRGSAAPYQYYLGSVKFEFTAIGITEIFLTVNDTLMISTTGMLNDLHFGAGDGALPVSVSGEGQRYIAAGVHGTLSDATIFIPEPGTVGLVVVAGVAMMRRRELSV
jgi:hypothetical protein